MSLIELNYRQLQIEAKRHGIKANQKIDILRALLIKLYIDKGYKTDNLNNMQNFQNEDNINMKEKVDINKSENKALKSDESLLDLSNDDISYADSKNNHDIQNFLSIKKDDVLNESLSNFANKEIDQNNNFNPDAKSETNSLIDLNEYESNNLITVLHNSKQEVASNKNSVDVSIFVDNLQSIVDINNVTLQDKIGINNYSQRLHKRKTLLGTIGNFKKTKYPYKNLNLINENDSLNKTFEIQEIDSLDNVSSENTNLDVENPNPNRKFKLSNPYSIYNKFHAVKMKFKNQEQILAEKSGTVSPIYQSPIKTKSRISKLLRNSEDKPLTNFKRNYSQIPSKNISPNKTKSRISKLLRNSEDKPLTNYKRNYSQIPSKNKSPIKTKSRISKLLRNSKDSPLLSNSKKNYPQVKSKNTASTKTNPKVSTLLNNVEDGSISNYNKTNNSTKTNQKKYSVDSSDDKSKRKSKNVFVRLSSGTCSSKRKRKSNQESDCKPTKAAIIKNSRIPNRTNIKK